MLFGRGTKRLIATEEAACAHLRLYAPLTRSVTLSSGASSWSLQGRHAGLGIEYTPTQWPLFIKAQADLSIYQDHDEAQDADSRAHEHSLSLRVGVGHDLQLWRGLHLTASATASLRRLVLHPGSTNISLELTRSRSTYSAGIGAELAPRWCFTKRVGLRFPLGIDYYPSSHYWTTPLQTFRLSPYSFYGGTALEVYL